DEVLAAGSMSSAWKTSDEIGQALVGRPGIRPWRNQPSGGESHVPDASGRPVYDGSDAAEMFRLYGVEARRSAAESVSPARVARGHGAAAVRPSAPAPAEKLAGGRPRRRCSTGPAAVPIMAGSHHTYISLYDRRVRPVADALIKNSKLGETEAVELAGHVLHAIDHIPGKVR
ncbi:MAG: hypothetical protein QOI36_1530, partial [Pseudonocardiales bacterium]|nr:hypothetical protein [Pseudonocardiales bacterium]